MGYKILEKQYKRVIKMNILAIGAHFDDLELGCGGSLLLWKSQGHHITIFIASKSGYTDSKGNIIRSNEIAFNEGQHAAEYIGANLIVGDIPTFDVAFSEPLNCKLIDISNTFKPDLVLTHWNGDVHHDHKSLSLATMHCFRHTQKLLMYCTNWYESNQRFDPRFFVDISDTFDSKLKLIEIYQSENNRTGGKWIDFIKAQSILFGLKTGVQYAEGFEIVKWVY